jgi:hypothetical protein
MKRFGLRGKVRHRSCCSDTTVDSPFLDSIVSLLPARVFVIAELSDCGAEDVLERVH